MKTTEKVTMKAAELGNSVEQVEKEIKRVASVKCRLKKMPGRSDFKAKMDLVTEEEELLKAVRDFLKGPKKNVNTLTAEQIAEMDYVEVTKAIKAIQSKKTHTRYADDCLKDEEGLFIPGSGPSFKEACRIEDMLKARRDEVAPVSVNVKFTLEEYRIMEDALLHVRDMFEESAGEINPCECDKDALTKVINKLVYACHVMEGE